MLALKTELNYEATICYLGEFLKLKGGQLYNI